MGAGSEGRIAEVYDAAVKMKDELDLTPLPATADQMTKKGFVFDAINALNVQANKDDEAKLKLWEGLFAKRSANPSFQSRVNALNKQTGAGSDVRIAQIYDAAVKISDQLGISAASELGDPGAKRSFVFDAINRLNKDDDAKLKLWEGLFNQIPAN
jgi:hypothetical protein